MQPIYYLLLNSPIPRGCQGKPHPNCRRQGNLSIIVFIARRKRCTPYTGCSKRPSSKAAASEEARRYGPHFVWPFACRMDLGERKNPSSDPVRGARSTR